MSKICISGDSSIKLIGDSITAGRGSSDCQFDGGYIMKLDGRIYYRQTGKRCYASILKKYLEEKYEGCQVTNNGCNGLNSFHICKYFETLVSLEDTVVFIMLGANNRKLPNGMNQLYHDLLILIKRLERFRAQPVLLNSGVSTAANESRRSRRYHMKDVCAVTTKLAEDTGVPYVDCYSYFENYMRENGISAEELLTSQEELKQYPLPESAEEYTIRDWNRCPDGLHPPDSVHRLIAEYIIDQLEL